MIRIKKAVLQGFGSIVGPTKFKWDREGLNVIIGSNGAGKTTWVSGLTWVLYGRSLKSKNIQMWKHRRPKDYQGVMGDVTFEKGNNVYKVIRCQDFKGKVEGSKGGNRLILLENGLPSKIRDKKPIQAEINRIIGYSEDLFLNTVMFGQGMKRIIEESGPNKKKVFEEAFESGFIKEGRDKADKDVKRIRPLYQEALMSYKDAHAKVDKYKSNITLIEEQRKEFETARENKIITLTGKLSSIQKKYDYSLKASKEVNREKIKGKIDKLKIKINNSNEKAIKELEDREFRQANLVDNLELQAERLTTQITVQTDNFKSLKKKCPTCGGKISKEKIKQEQENIKGRIAELKTQRGELKTQIAAEKSTHLEVKSKLSSITKDKSNLSELKYKLKHYESVLDVHQVTLNNVSTYKRQLKEIKREFEALNEEKFPDKLKDLPKKLKEAKKVRRTQKKLYRAFEKDIKDLEWIIGDALGNKGLRAYIFDTMLKGLNDKLTYYQQYAGYRVEFNVDLESANKDIYTLCYDGEDMIDYEDLSGGQKKTVDICTAFAIHDLVAGDKPINLMVFDEVFDSLDAEHIDLVYELISEKSRGKSVYLITHNLELQNSSDKIIRMSLDDKGHTVLKTLSA